MRPHAKLIKIRLAGNDAARCADLLDDCGIVGARERLEDARGGGRRKFGGADVVFDRYESAIEKSWEMLAKCRCQSNLDKSLLTLTTRLPIFDLPQERRRLRQAYKGIEVLP
jgi:ATP-dependent helicase YprA (DUF1998 family)